MATLHVTSGNVYILCSSSEYGLAYKFYIDGVLEDSGYTNSSGSATLVGPASIFDDGVCYEMYCRVNGVDSSLYAYQDGSISIGTCSGGGEDEEEEYASSPSIYSITAINGTYADNILKFEFEANLRNPNSDTLYARYQCKFGNGSTTYYAPYYDGSGTKPSRGLNPGIGNYMKCFSTSHNSTISYAYYPSTTAPGTYTATIPVYISLYYAEFLNDTSITQTAFTDRQFDLTIEYTIGENYDDFFWADGTTTISSGDTFTDKIDASTWLDLISKVNKLKGTNISTSGV